MESMVTKRDYYEVLGVSKEASDSEISRAYRKLAVKYHPDAHSGDDEITAKFKEAAEAFEVLSDSEKRARYDRFGHAGVDGAGAQFGSAEDIFEAFGEIFGGGVFGDFFGGGGGGRRGRRVQRGADVRVDVALTLEEAARGIEKEVRFNRSVICQTCDGAGSRPGSSPEVCRRCGGHGNVVQSAGILRVQTTCPACRGQGRVITDPCETCHGEGQTRERVTLTVSIPAGVDDGMRVRIRGEGEPSPNGGPAGDCYCFVSIKPHRIFHREGSDLLLRLPITYPQAALGATLHVPTLDGPEELDIDKGTQTGAVYRMRGHGMPHPHGQRKGDLLVETFIEVPKKLSTRQEELLRELAEIENKDVTPHRKSFLEKLKDYFTHHDETQDDQQAS